PPTGRHHPGDGRAAGPPGLPRRDPRAAARSCGELTMATATTATTRGTPTPTPAKQALHLAGRGWNKALWLLMMRMHRTHLTRYAMYQALATAVGDGPGSVPPRGPSISHPQPLAAVCG